MVQNILHKLFISVYQLYLTERRTCGCCH